MNNRQLNSPTLPSSKKLQSPKKPRNIIPLLILTSLLVVISIYFPYCFHKLPVPSYKNIDQVEEPTKHQCDLFTGEWVPNPDGPYYTNLTCEYFIQDHQNCMKYGRPDDGYMKWRWKPDDCDLEVFSPARFLDLMRGKSLAFVGDSVARNHMQSLLCLLGKVAFPVDLSDPRDQNRFYVYKEYNFNLTMHWAPYLVKFGKSDESNDEKPPFHLYLDEPDHAWTSKIEKVDYIIISAGPWFFRPTYFYLNRTLQGCLYCPESNITHLTYTYSYERAFRVALQAINNANFKGVTFLRTYAPAHFEGGEWDSGGNCARTRPFKRNETTMEGKTLDLYTIQQEVLRVAQEEGRGAGRKFRLFDATKPMLLRPDGHPSKYGHPAGANVVLYNDCVHWCLPGPVDSWNDFLQELLIRELRN